MTNAIAIEEGKVVDIAYSLKNEQGEVLDRSDPQNPLTYLHGAHEIVPGLEAALEGLKPGAKKHVVVPAEEGYGEADPQLKMIVSRTQFPEDAQIVVGMSFKANASENPDDDEDEIVFTVKGIEGEKIFIDGNHPLAGATLYFEIEVIGVRDASADEVEHGHAHGPEGHGSHHIH